MTGSGKTGLCISLLEEAAIDNIPAIIIDPKGDLANLLLTFPDLSPGDFQPWINPDDAAQKGLSPADFAKQQAAAWKKGLEGWGQDGARIKKLKDAADFVIYTPGSNAGIPISILKSFAAPPVEVLEDNESFTGKINSTTTSLLGLVGLDTDPLKSREHILISTILANAWKNGQDLDLAALVQQIQDPPVKKIGVLNLDSFFPAKDRVELSLAINNLLAAPGFSAWLEGDAAGYRSDAALGIRKTLSCNLLNRSSQRRRAHVLRLAASKSDSGVDADSTGNQLAAGSACIWTRSSDISRR
jgi:hypothetical protein